MQDFQRSFLDLAVARQALRFGSFKLKSGRDSPYFFNAGLFNDGEAIAMLGRCYAAALQRSGIAVDMLFGPAYKGIPLVAVTAAALAEHHRTNLPWAFNRKETKDHGEGGLLVGAPLKGRVAIVDDVITAGTAIRESVELIRRSGANPVAVLLALDRQERGQGAKSAAQEVAAEYGVQCVSIVTLVDLIEYYGGPAGDALRISTSELARLKEYRERYGIEKD